jgi:plastocyanin
VDARFGFTLLGALLLAVAIGLIAAHAQPQTVAAPPLPTLAPTPLPPPARNHVDITPNGSFNPATLTARTGTKVTWTNLNSQAQSVTADNGAFSSSPLSTGQTFTWTPHSPGTYAYGSYLNPDLRGTIVVKP